MNVAVAIVFACAVSCAVRKPTMTRNERLPSPQRARRPQHARTRSTLRSTTCAAASRPWRRAFACSPRSAIASAATHTLHPIVASFTLARAPLVPRVVRFVRCLGGDTIPDIVSIAPCRLPQGLRRGAAFVRNQLPGVRAGVRGRNGPERGHGCLCLELRRATPRERGLCGQYGRRRAASLVHRVLL